MIFTTNTRPEGHTRQGSLVALVPAWLLGGTLLATTMLGCGKIEEPTLKPEGVEVKTVAVDGVTVDVTIDVYNPNSIELSARSVKAHSKLDQKIDLGEVDVKTPLDIPAGKHAKLTVPLKLRWNDVTSVALLAASKPSIDFSVDGTAKVGGKSVNFDIPFHTGGTLSQAQLIEITTKALPKIPKLTF